MTWAQAVKAAHRINQQAVYGTQARHVVTPDGRHAIALTVPCTLGPGLHTVDLGTFTCVELARVAAGL